MRKLTEQETKLTEKSNYINPKAYEMLQEDISFWIENKGDYEAGEALGEVLHTLISELGQDYDPNGFNYKKLIRFKNGLKNTL